MEKLINDIKQLACRHEGVQVYDPRFLSMLRDVHDFRYDRMLNRLLSLLYKEGTIKEVCETSHDNLRSLISILSDNVHRKHSEFAETDVIQVLYAFAIAVDIITLDEYRHPVVEKKEEQKQPAKRVSQRKEIVSEQKKPVVIRKKPSPVVTNSRAKIGDVKYSWLYVLYAFAVFCLISLRLSRFCLRELGTEWSALRSFCYVLGDMVSFLLLVLCPKMWKPATTDGAGFAFLSALLMTLFIKSFVPFAWDINLSAGGMVIILAEAVVFAAMSFVLMAFIKRKYVWFYVLSLLFLIGLTLLLVRPA